MAIIQAQPTTCITSASYPPTPISSSRPIGVSSRLTSSPEIGTSHWKSSTPFATPSTRGPTRTRTQEGTQRGAAAQQNIAGALESLRLLQPLERAHAAPGNLPCPYKLRARGSYATSMPLPFLPAARLPRSHPWHHFDKGKTRAKRDRQSDPNGGIPVHRPSHALRPVPLHRFRL